MTVKGCNGWSNYETWCVSLWMSNDAGSDEFYREIAQEVYDDAEAETSFTHDEVATRILSDRLKDDMEERQGELVGVTGVFADLLGAALSEVNWYEIAEHCVDDVDKEWTCFSCGTEQATADVPRCPVCKEPVCSDCKKLHADSHDEEGQS